MFFKDNRGSYWPISSIAEIDKERSRDASHGKVRVHTVTLKGDGGQVEVSWIEAQRILRESSPFWPAVPGTYVVYRDLDNGEAVTTKRPVIAWCNSPDEGVLPVTIEGPNDGASQQVAVLMPSGEVVTYGNKWDDLNAFETDPDGLQD